MRRLGWSTAAGIVVAAMATLATACAADPSTTVTGAVTTTTPTSEPADASTTSTAMPARPVPATCATAVDGWVELSGGRRMLVRRPATASVLPAVVTLHGYDSRPEEIERSSGWTTFLADKQAAAVYPEGSPVTGSSSGAVGGQGFGWDTGSARFSTTGADDGAFLAAVADALVGSGCIDPARIVLTGASNGAAMALLAACDPKTNERFHGFGLVIPAIDDGVLRRCGDGPPVHFVALAGRRDQAIPYDGVYPPGDAPLLGQQEWFSELVVKRNGCRTPLDRRPIDDAEMLTPLGCERPPTLIAITDGIHSWPGGPIGDDLTSSGTFPATATLWQRLVS